MSKEGRALQKIEREKRKERNLDLLKANKIAYKILDRVSGHLRIGEFDIWITTGKFHKRTTNQWGEGVMNLINALGNQDSRFCPMHDDESCFGEVIQCNECKFYLKEI